MYRDFYSNRGDSPTISLVSRLAFPRLFKSEQPYCRSAINEDNPSSLPRYDGVVGIGRETWETREGKSRSPAIASLASLSRLYTSIVKF